MTVAVAPAVVDGRYLAFQAHPDVIGVMAALGIGYWYAVTRLGPSRAERTSRRQVGWWYASLVTLWVFAWWPVDELADHYSFAVHMLEHEVFILVAAPMMLLGTPDWLVRWAVVDRPWYPLVRRACRPAPAIALYTAVMMAGHWPAVVNESTRNEWFHFGAHLTIYLSALALWMPLVNRIPELTRLSRPTKILYLFVMSVPSTLPTLWLIFSTGVIYASYAGGPEYLGFSVIADQDWAGAVMGALGMGLVWVLVAYHFFAWYGEEQRAEAVGLPERLTRERGGRELVGKA